MTATPEGCGVLEHDTECLCDVVIPHPTGWVGDAIQDMWMGLEIAQMKDYRMPWEDHTIIDYLESLAFAKDNWPHTKGMTALEMMAWIEQTKVLIRQKLASSSASITVVMDALELDMADMNMVLFSGRREWTLEKLVAFESAVLSGEHTNPGSLGRQFGLPYKSSAKLASYWGVQWPENQNKTINGVIDRIIAEHPGVTSVGMANLATEHLAGIGVIVSITDQRIDNRKFYLKNRKGRKWK